MGLTATARTLRRLDRTARGARGRAHARAVARVRAGQGRDQVDRGLLHDGPDVDRGAGERARISRRRPRLPTSSIARSAPLQAAPAAILPTDTFSLPPAARFGAGPPALPACAAPALRVSWRRSPARPSPRFLTFRIEVAGRRGARAPVTSGRGSQCPGLGGRPSTKDQTHDCPDSTPWLPPSRSPVPQRRTPWRRPSPCRPSS